MSDIEERIVKAIVAGMTEEAKASGAYFESERAEGANFVLFDGLIDIQKLARRVAAAVKDEGDS